MRKLLPAFSAASNSVSFAALEPPVAAAIAEVPRRLTA